jgi:cytochrome b6-f complex iron-sulfur subunit
MDLSRRDFVAGACAACLTCAAAPAFAQTASGPVVDAGEVAALKEGITDAFAKSGKILVVRKGDTLFAETAICTHKNVTLRIVDGLPRCPGHGSRFDLDGKATKGPAFRPLGRYAVSIKDGHLLVDTSKPFGPDDYAKDGASVKIP